MTSKSWNNRPMTSKSWNNIKIFMLDHACKSSLFLSWLLHKNIKGKMRIYVIISIIYNSSYITDECLISEDYNTTCSSMSIYCKYNLSLVRCYEENRPFSYPSFPLFSCAHLNIHSKATCLPTFIFRTTIIHFWYMVHCVHIMLQCDIKY